VYVVEEAEERIVGAAESLLPHCSFYYCELGHIIQHISERLVRSSHVDPPQLVEHTFRRPQVLAVLAPHLQIPLLLGPRMELAVEQFGFLHAGEVDDASRHEAEAIVVDFELLGGGGVGVLETEGDDLGGVLGDEEGTADHDVVEGFLLLELATHCAIHYNVRLRYTVSIQEVHC
jgi:hypothetical protein